MISIVYPYGEQLIPVPAGEKVEIYSLDIAIIEEEVGFPNHPPTYQLIYTTAPGELFTTSAFADNSIVRISAKAAIVKYDVAVNPSVTAIVTDAIQGTEDPFDIRGVDLPTGGGDIRVIGGNSTQTGGTGGGEAFLIGGNGFQTGSGGTAVVQGGTAGSVAGMGGNVILVGGSAGGPNSEGGNIQLRGGAGNGTGADGYILMESPVSYKRSVSNKTVSTLLTLTEFLGGIITVNQGAGANSNLQLPTGTIIDSGFPSADILDTYILTIVNTSVIVAETATITTNTGLTLIGNMVIDANTSAQFSIHRTGINVWSVYRTA